MAKSIKSRDIRKQALAWYYWGHYAETNQFTPDSAFNYLSRSASLFKDNYDSLSYFWVRTELAVWLVDRGFDDEALFVLEEARDFFHRNKFLERETYSLAQLYRLEPTQTSQPSKTYRKPEQYLADFNENNKQLQDTLLEIIVLVKKADRLQKSRYFRDASNSGYIALSLATRKNLPLYIAHANYAIGLAALSDREYENAEKYLKAAEAIPLPPLQLELKRNLCLSLSELNQKTGKLEQGIEYAVRYGQLSDTLLSQRRASALQKVSLQFNTKEKEKTIENLQKEKTEAESQARLQFITNMALIAALAGAIIAAIVLVRDYRHRIYTDRIIAEQNEALNQKQIQELENSLRIETMQSMIAGQESERERVAKDMHDSVGGLLAAIKINFQSLSDKYKKIGDSAAFANINHLLDETVAETRNIAHNLQPGALFQFGLVKAIQDLCGRFNGKGGPEISFQSIGDFSGLEDQKALNCYRIVQEMLQNSVKHAEAQEILVQVTRDENEITLLVEDNGKGFDLNNFQKGMGTDNLSYRVKFLNGELSVHSEKGKGTSSMVTIPCAVRPAKP